MFFEYWGVPPMTPHKNKKTIKSYSLPLNHKPACNFSEKQTVGMNLRYILLSFTDGRCIRPLSLKKYCAHKLVTRSKGLQHILILLAIWPLSSRWGNWFFHYTIVVSFPLSFWLQQLYRENEKKRKEKITFMLLLFKIHLCTHSYIPSDGSGLADQVWKFAVSGVWQQHATCSSHNAE